MESYCYGCFLTAEGTGPCPVCGFSESENRRKYPLALHPGSILCGRYVVGKVLGQGGFGITYLGMDVREHRRVAIKEYFPNGLVTRTDRKNIGILSPEREEAFYYGKKCFLNEAKVIARLRGIPNIVQVYQYFEENDTAYYAMEFVEGQSLQSYMRSRGGSLPWGEACEKLLPIMQAMESIHGKGIIHRDIAPDNICITESGGSKLLDFGAARYSLGEKSGSLDTILKHGFAPIEQYSRHGRQGPYTDVYAMGATFYYALTGKTPPASVDRIERDSHTQADTDMMTHPKILCLPDRARSALTTALNVYAQKRFQSMQAFIDSIGEKVLPGPVSSEDFTVEVFGRKIKNSLLIILAVVLILLFMLLLTMVSKSGGGGSGWVDF